MKEIKFLHKNIKKWKHFESLLENNKDWDPDRLFELYISLTDDLAYAKSYYPESESYAYLNQLTRKVHAIIYRNKPMEKKRIISFWGKEFPLLFRSIQKEFLISLFIFILAILIGILSTRYEPSFAKTILGDKYINMTMRNIHENDPMAVYKQMNEVQMFLGITLNNIRVSFLAFVFGIFTAFGTGFVLFSNGVMLGTFHAFLAQQGVVVEAFASLWLHGTIEIFSIIVAGAAGIHIGNSFIFPGTYKRSHALQKAALKSARIVLGLVPFFIIAGFIEGFITRHTEMSYAVRFTIIACSLAFIVYYFFIYPKLLIKKNLNHGSK